MCDAKHACVILQTYINMGWGNLTSIFNKYRHAKEKTVKPEINENLLILLGKLRIYIIDEYFNHFNKHNDTRYVAYGSTNITSDYDLTIIGKHAPDLMRNIFMCFLKTYQQTLLHSFDTNLYTATVYSPKGINKLKCIHIIDDKSAIIMPLKENKDIVLSFAFIKLIEINVNKYLKSSHRNISRHMRKALSLKKTLDKIFSAECRKTKRKYKSCDVETIKLIARYNLQYKYAKILYDILYSRKKGSSDGSKLIYYACITTYFSVEAYYTPNTLNVVVQELQAKEKLSLTKYDYICAAIENLGDMINHMRHEMKKGTSKVILLKYSKYIYRIYYSIGKALNNKVLKNKADNINDKVIPYRKTGEIDKVEYSMLEYKNESLNKYLDNFAKHILFQIEKAL